MTEPHAFDASRALPVTNIVCDTACPAAQTRRATGYHHRVAVSEAETLYRHLKCTGELLSSIVTGYDATTLREKVDLHAAGARLEELGELRSLAALNEKVSLLRLVGRLDEAWDVANQAARQARFTGDREELLAARIRRAQVMQFRGMLQEAQVELTTCADEARAHDWARLEAFALQHRGKVYFDQGELELALADFQSAVQLRQEPGNSPDELESSLIAVTITQSFIDERRAERREA